MNVDVYPTLRRDCILRSYEVDGIDRSAIWNIFNRKHVELNKDSEQLIRLMTGASSIKDIIHIICEKYPLTPQGDVERLIFDGIEKIGDFLEISETKRDARKFPEKKQMRSLLDRIYIRLTKACNLACVHCSVNAGVANSDEFSYERWVDIIDQIAELGIPSIIFTGGEPTLVNCLPKLIRYASSKPISIGLMTNGLEIDAESSAELASSGLKHVNISLDGAVPKTHDLFRGVQGAYKKAVEAIKLFKKLDIAVETTSIINSNNEPEIDDLIKLVSALGVDKMKFTPIVPIQRGKACDYNKSFQVYKRNIEKYMRFMKDDMSQDHNPIMELDSEGALRCNAGEGVLCIASEGTVYPCNNFETIVLGSLIESSLHDIVLNSLKLTDVTRLLKIRGSECENCSELNECRGGCAMLAFSYSGSYSTCDIVRKVYIEELKKSRGLLHA